MRRCSLVVLLVAALLSALAAGPALAKKPKPKHPKIGHLEGCVFITNNGDSSTENVKVLDTRAHGYKGKIHFNGEGLNKTSPFTLGSNGTAVVPFLVTTFGTSTITVTLSSVPPMSYTMQFTLGSANDVTQTDCTPH
jgi:hypothetical protein